MPDGDQQQQQKSPEEILNALKEQTTEVTEEEEVGMQFPDIVGMQYERVEKQDSFYEELTAEIEEIENSSAGMIESSEGSNE